ncbi:uncharacterized protein LOC129588642 [Paramacrobiotus metropolitanus]|uniref:uncharacterized protein LOC129588642 n=1 Tax=Paramacrobiotus metropolitanus TaxID=2943436 RepID=UPI0024456252|nr:uncharacterized protein LOC129588642 [Paramacrobiotus metropolitanus]
MSSDKQTVPEKKQVVSPSETEKTKPPAPRASVGASGKPVAKVRSEINKSAQAKKSAPSKAKTSAAKGARKTGRKRKQSTSSESEPEPSEDESEGDGEEGISKPSSSANIKAGISAYPPGGIRVGLSRKHKGASLHPDLGRKLRSHR